MDNENISVSEIIGRIKTAYEGEIHEFDVHRDGTVFLPDGTISEVPKDVLESLLEADAKTRQVQAQSLAEKTTVPKKMTPEQLTSMPKKMHDEEEFRQLAAEGAKAKKQLILIIMCIFVTILIVVCVVALKYWPMLSGAITNKYEVAVLNKDIPKDGIITDGDITMKTIDGDAFKAYMGAQYTSSSGKIHNNAAIFFSDRATAIVQKYAMRDMKANEVITYEDITPRLKLEVSSSSASTQESEPVKPTASNDEGSHDSLVGETTIEYVAIITTANGEQYQVPMSTVSLNGSEIKDIISADGKSILGGAT